MASDDRYLKTDRSIKPKDMIVGDLVVGHHDGDPFMPVPDIYERGCATPPRKPLEVARILRVQVEREMPGVYCRHPPRGDLERYVEYDPGHHLWIIVRDRLGVPRLIEEYPNRCPRCKGKVYVGLKEVVHESGCCVA